MQRTRLMLCQSKSSALLLRSAALSARAGWNRSIGSACATRFHFWKLFFSRQVPVPVAYKGRRLDNGYRLDVLVGPLVIAELKVVEQVEPIHEAQSLTYLKLTNLWLGLLINFNVPLLKQGIRRFAGG